MDKLALIQALDTAVQKYEKGFSKLQQNHSYCSDDVQSAMNGLGDITLTALREFRNAIIKNLE